VGVKLSKVTDKKARTKCLLASNMTFFSFALMIIFAFHATISSFSKCFPRKGKEQNHSQFCPPPLVPVFWEWGICPFTPCPYALEKVFKFIYINSI